tara:strand:- start:7659 stop:8063 length:405 start_codon:yes stop_codon:yes gene_type:complete
MKITNQQLRKIIKEELQKVLDEAYVSPPIDHRGMKAFDDRRAAHKKHKGPHRYTGLKGGSIASIEQDPNIPPEHKKKLIALFKSGIEGIRQAQEIMDAMGYEGVETVSFSERGPFEPRNPFKDPPAVHRINDEF